MLQSLRLLAILLLMQLLVAPRAGATGVLFIGGSASNNHATTGTSFSNSAAMGPISDSGQTLNGAPPGSGSEIETVFATADYGSLGVSAGGKVVGPVTDGSLGAAGNATAGFSDVFTVTAAGLAGTTGTITAVFGLAAFVLVNGGGGCDGTAQASYGINATATGSGGTGSSIHSGTWTDTCFQPNTFSGDPPGTFSLPITAHFGAPMQLSVILSASNAASWDTLASGAATATGDFAHTLTWGGFTEVRDAQGNLVTHYTVTSDSGTDWSKPVPVPEPGTLPLVGAGLGGLVRVGRRRPAV